MDFKELIQLCEFGLKVAVGIWAVFLLIYLRKGQLAQADLAEKGARIREIDVKIRDIEFQHKQAIDKIELQVKKEELQIKETELRIRQQANLVVDLEPGISHSPDGNGYVIVVAITLINRGNKQTKIVWNDPTFLVHLVTFNDKGQPDHVEKIRLNAMSTMNPRIQALPLTVRAGGTETLAFVCRVETAGLYRLSFRGPVAAETAAEVAPETAAEVDPIRPSAWTCNKYVDVSNSRLWRPRKRRLVNRSL